MIVQQPLILCEEWGGHLCICLGTVQYWWISIGLVIVQLRAVFCPSVQYLSFFCHAFSWTILDSSSFPLSFMSWYALLLLFFLIFSSISLHCSPIQFSFAFFMHLLNVVVHFLVFLRSFRFESFLSKFSPFVAQIKKILQWHGFFLVMMFAKDLTSCSSNCCVEGGDHWISGYFTTNVQSTSHSQ